MEDEVPAPRIKPNTVGELGQRLLTGWVMLAEVCPDCEVPLMRKGRTCPEMVCVNCDGTFIDDPVRGIVPPLERPATPLSVQPTHRPYNSPQPAPSGDPAAGVAAGGADVAEHDADLAGTHAELAGTADRLAASSDDVAANGDVVVRDADLAGRHADLAAHVAQLAASSSAEVAGHDPDLAGIARGGDLGEKTAVQAPAVRPRLRGSLTDGDRVSRELAAKMLEGWTLLAQHCPLCLTPLIRSRAKETRCVSCDLPVHVVSEGSTLPYGASAAAAKPSGLAEQVRACPATAQPSQGLVSMAEAVVTSSAGPFRGFSPTEPLQREAVGEPLQGWGFATRSGQVLPDVPTSGSMACMGALEGGGEGGRVSAGVPGSSGVFSPVELVDRATATLLLKLHEAERKLAALPVEDTVQCTAYINLTAAAAKALISLLGLACGGLL